MSSKAFFLFILAFTTKECLNFLEFYDAGTEEMFKKLVHFGSYQISILSQRESRFLRVDVSTAEAEIYMATQLQMQAVRQERIAHSWLRRWHGSMMTLQLINTYGTLAPSIRSKYQKKNTRKYLKIPRKYYYISTKMNHHPQIFGNWRALGFCGIQPCRNPA